MCPVRSFHLTVAAVGAEFAVAAAEASAVSPAGVRRRSGGPTAGPDRSAHSGRSSQHAQPARAESLLLQQGEHHTHTHYSINVIF